MNFTYGWVYQTLYIFFHPKMHTHSPTYINISKIEKTDKFIKMIPEFIKKSIKLLKATGVCLLYLPSGA